MTDNQIYTQSIRPYLAELGDKLRQIRIESLHMTLDSMAQWMNVGPKRIAKIESGESYDLELICKYCERVSIKLDLTFEVY